MDKENAQKLAALREHERMAAILEAKILQDEASEQEKRRLEQVLRQNEIDKRSNKGQFARFKNNYYENEFMP